jgi:hypothetical protein
MADHHYLYEVITHPVTLLPMIRTYEIVGRTPAGYDLQLRRVLNKRAMAMTKRIKKASVGKKYHRTPEQAVEWTRRKLEHRLRNTTQQLEALATRLKELDNITNISEVDNEQ